MSKKLTMQNGDVRDADRLCDECGRTVSPSSDYCPHCGEAL